MKNLLSVLFIIGILSSCLVTEEKFTAIPPGPWRALLYLGDSPLAAVSMGETEQDDKLPFNFNVQYITADSFIIILKNGAERIVLSDITFGHNRATGRDSLLVRFPEYGSYIKAYYEEDILEGRWYDPSRGEYSIPFLARHGISDRFFKHDLEAKQNLTGRYACEFGIETKDGQWPAIGEFVQNGHRTTGTFLTETGDYRYLEGIADEELLWLSTFDGAHAFLFKAKIIGDSLSGFFKSGNHYETLWAAKRGRAIDLKDAYDLTRKTSTKPLSFDYISSTGDTVSWSAELKENGKPTVIQIMGSWCPNCKDETQFLGKYLQKNPEAFDLISVGFERFDNYKDAYKNLNRYREQIGVPYPMFYGGKASKKVASEVFSDLSGITSFPTLIFLNKAGEVYKVHTGFNGPATSKYEEYKESFYRIIEELNRTS